MRWIARSIPVESRWYPVFERYLVQLGERVRGMGGNPVLVFPSPAGNWWEPGGGREGGGGHEGDHGHEGGKGHEGGRGHCHADLEFTGKVVGVDHDRFGDFEGFLLQELCSGGIVRFRTRHVAMAEVVEYAWRAQVTVSVFADRRERESPVSVVYREPPAV